MAKFKASRQPKLRKPIKAPKRKPSKPKAPAGKVAVRGYVRSKPKK